MKVLGLLLFAHYCLCLPSSVNWANSGNVPPVSDEGQLGTPGIIVTADLVSSMYSIKHGGAPPTLSQQQLIDCAGGSAQAELAQFYLEYIIHAGGIETESSYPYNGEVGSCHFDKNKVFATVTSMTNVTSELMMQKVVASQGPVAAGVDASAWEYYNGGIFEGPCGNQVDHDVLVVGYDTTSNGTQYWIIQNSWGPSWGEQGFIYLEMGKDLCGIADFAVGITVA